MQGAEDRPQHLLQACRQGGRVVIGDGDRAWSPACRDQLAVPAYVTRQSGHELGQLDFAIYETLRQGGHLVRELKAFQAYGGLSVPNGLLPAATLAG
jgi:hypothetical protein